MTIWSDNNINMYSWVCVMLYTECVWRIQVFSVMKQMKTKYLENFQLVDTKKNGQHKTGEKREDLKK